MSMTPSQFDPFLEEALPAGINVMVIGKPGVGKTQIPKEVTKRLGRRLFVSHPVTEEPINYGGFPMPNVQTGLVDFVPIGTLREMLECDEPATWLIDDMGMAPPINQGAILQLADHDSRNLGGHVLPEDIGIVITTNNIDDNAGVTSFNSALLDRLVVIELEVSVDDWVNWAFANQVHPAIIAYIQTKPPALHTWVPNSNPLDKHATPRGWTHMSKLMNLKSIDQDPSNFLAQNAFKGCIGDALTYEFTSFLALRNEVASPAQIEADPKGVPVPDPMEMGINYLSVNMLAHYAAHNPDKAKHDALMIWINRLDPEWRKIWTHNTLTSNPDLGTQQEYTRWVLDQQDILS